MIRTDDITTFADIEERFMHAAKTERRRHVDGTGPAKMKSSMPSYVHDWADKNGWGSERLKEERAEFFSTVENRITPQDVTAMEECERWTAEHVDEPKHRRALWAWAAAQNRDASFKAWCERNGVSQKTGRSWKNAAVRAIYAQVVRSDVQRRNSMPEWGFTESPVSTYLPDTVENDAQAVRPLSWRDDPSLDTILDEPRNRVFRQRDAKPVHLPEVHEPVKRKAA